MLQLIVDTFISLFVVIDPVGLAPIFIGLTLNSSAEHRRRMAIKGTTIAALILVFFLFVGDELLHALGIGLPAFRIAGGALLFLIAIDMLFVRHSGVRSTTAEEQQEAVHKNDISVFPLAIPLIAGPGALTTVLLMVSTTDRAMPVSVTVVVVGVLLAVLLLTLLALLLADAIVGFMGETGANVVSRVLGVLLAALAVQYMIDGLRGGLLGPA
jgi:multiple antibiotic resistance protein